MGFASVFCQSTYLGPPCFFIQQLSVEPCCLCQRLFPLSWAVQCSLKHSNKLHTCRFESKKVLKGVILAGNACFHSIRSIKGPSNKTYIPTSSYTPENGPLAGQSGPEGNNFSRHYNNQIISQTTVKFQCHVVRHKKLWFEDAAGQRLPAPFKIFL